MAGLADLITDDDVMALLIGRSPRILDTTGDRRQFYYRTVVGVAAEVEAVTGPTPPSALLPLALWCVSLGVAASLDAALYPDQIQAPEDGGRATDLRSRYEAVLSSLRAQVGQSATGRPQGHPVFDVADFVIDPYLRDWWTDSRRR